MKWTNATRGFGRIAPPVQSVALDLAGFVFSAADRQCMLVGCSILTCACCFQVSVGPFDFFPLPVGVPCYISPHLSSQYAAATSFLSRSTLLSLPSRSIIRPGRCFQHLKVNDLSAFMQYYHRNWKPWLPCLSFSLKALRIPIS